MHEQDTTEILPSAGRREGGPTLRMRGAGVVPLTGGRGSFAALSILCHTIGTHDAITLLDGCLRFSLPTVASAKARRFPSCREVVADAGRDIVTVSISASLTPLRALVGAVAFDGWSVRP